MAEKNSINLQQFLERHTIDFQRALEDRRLIEDIARRKEFSSLYELALTIEEITNEKQGGVTFDLVRSASAQYYLANLYESIEQALFLLPGGIDTLVRLTQVRPAFFASYLSLYTFTRSLHCRQRERYYAAKIVAYQQADEVLAAIERHAAHENNFELLFLLVHELVLQNPGDGKELSQHPLLRALHQRMREQMHPLGWLPLSKMALEEGIRGSKPQENFGTSAHGSYEFDFSHWGTGGPEPGIPPFEGGVYAQVRSMPVTNDTAYRSISSAVLNWMVESNGKFEAHCIAFDVPFPQERFTPSMLVGRGFEALDGVQEKDIIFQPISAREAYNILFRSAAIGGDLGGGCFGAYGRLYAWQSLAGLVGTSGASLETIFEVAQQSICCYVWAPSQWFYQIVTEFGLFVLRPDRRSGAFLAATDTD